MTETMKVNVPVSLDLETWQAQQSFNKFKDRMQQSFGRSSGSGANQSVLESMFFTGSDKAQRSFRKSLADMERSFSRFRSQSQRTHEGKTRGLGPSAVSHYIGGGRGAVLN